MYEVQGCRAHFPDTAVRLTPAHDRRFHNLSQEVPPGGFRTIAALAPTPRKLDDRAVHVGLILALGRVANSHRPRAPPAVQILQRQLGDAALAIDRIENLQLLGLARGASLNEPA